MSIRLGLITVSKQTRYSSMSNIANIHCGNDVRIHDNAFFTNPYRVKLGNHVAIDYGFYCTTQFNSGDYVHISSHVSVIGGSVSKLDIDHFGFVATGSRIVCGSDEMLGAGMVGPFIPDEYEDNKIISTIKIGMFAGVGCNSTLLPGAELATGSILGANSLLKGRTEPWTIYAGSPARPISDRRSDKIISNAREMGYL